MSTYHEGLTPTVTDIINFCCSCNPLYEHTILATPSTSPHRTQATGRTQANKHRGAKHLCAATMQSSHSSARASAGSHIPYPPSHGLSSRSSQRSSSRVDEQFSRAYSITNLVQPNSRSTRTNSRAGLAGLAVQRSRPGTTAEGRRPPRTPEAYKFLRRRTESPGTMRHNQIKDDLASMMAKHKREVQKEVEREQRKVRAEQDRIEYEQEMRKQARADSEADDGADGRDAAGPQQLPLLESKPPQPSASVLVAAPVEVSGTGHMAELSDSMQASFRSSLEKVAKSKDPLQRRLIGKKAAEAERSNLLRILAALRGQRHRLNLRFFVEDEERNASRFLPIPKAIIGTKFGELSAGDDIQNIGDEEAWLKESLGSKKDALLGLNQFSSLLTTHMPPLVDIAHQREQLERESQFLSDKLSAFESVRRRSVENGSLEGHSERLLRERETMRHSWNGTGSTSSAVWYRDENFEQTGTGRSFVPAPPNWPFKAHYPASLESPLHGGVTKVFARQALARCELATILRSDPATQGMVPHLPPSTSQRVAPHMHHLLSCVPATDKARMTRGAWKSWQNLMEGKSTLDPHIGKLINTSMKLAKSTVASNSHVSTIKNKEWSRSQATRCWEPTSAPGPTEHPVNCCCLSCSIRLQGEHPETRSLYRRLSTNEAGNTGSFCHSGMDVVSPRGAHAGIIRRPSQVGAGPLHPQIPSGYRSPPRPKPTRSPASVEAKSPRIKGVTLFNASRGGVADSLRFSASVDGLAETL